MLDVFVRDGGGGNPVPLVADARGMSDLRMQQVAAAHGHESAFVLPSDRPGCDWRLRFFVPAHEMEMCGHATVGTLWALRQWGIWTTQHACVETLSGPVNVIWNEATGRVGVSQPAVTTRLLDAHERAAVARVLGLPPDAADSRMVNASTSRVKTLVRMPGVQALHALQPDFGAMASLCESIGSTGLYPFAMGEPGLVHARQFPKSSGYPEDAATGIAAAALWGFLATVEAGGAQPLRVRQGEAMGRPSEIQVTPRFSRAAGGAMASDGCWLSGDVRWAQA